MSTRQGINRRELLVGSAAAAALPFIPSVSAAQTMSGQSFDPSSPFPHKDAFFPFEGTYLNNASQHPMSRIARQAADHYLDFKKFSAPASYSFGEIRDRVRENYAKLINADLDEICFVPSTTVGENLILQALGIPGTPGRVVTDELHFVGSLPTYSELAKQGMDVVTIRASEDGSLDLEKYEKAITDETRLVAVSHVSMLNGFQHDLKELCKLAHAKGALVYADTVQSVGNTPLDVRDSGVDFTSAAGYKWLMGDMGLGLMSVRKDRLSSLRRPWYGSGQLARRQHLGFPNPDAGSDQVTEYEYLDSALGYFAMGTQSNIVAAELDVSLQYLLAVGVERIQAYRQPLIDYLQDELPNLGYPTITPRGTGSAIVSFRHDDADGLRKRLSAQNITITVSEHYFRVSISVFNDRDDVARLVRTLA
jgi:selenocysteine lyase/cysteine desulfurase